MLQEGLARFATSDYRAPGASKRSIKDRYMHLTNYSVNKRNERFERNTDASRDDEGSKWSLSATMKHLAQAGADVRALRERIHDLVVKTIIAVEVAHAPTRHRVASHSGGLPHHCATVRSHRPQPSSGASVRSHCPQPLSAAHRSQPSSRRRRPQPSSGAMVRGKVVNYLEQ